jgi:DNA processing protein
MTPGREHAALVALLRLPGVDMDGLAMRAWRGGSAVAELERELAAPHGQGTLLPADPEPLLVHAEAEIAAWRRRGWRALSVLDASFPANLQAVHDRPPLIFVAGEMQDRDSRAIAVIGSRRPTDQGLRRAVDVARHLVREGFTVVSGLAAGIDTAAHLAALECGGRTLAVIGTGLAHGYPPENAALQRRIADEGAVISQFLPDTPPSRATFPRRNGVMSGLTQATVIVEAGVRSGARVQARLALGQGRPVFLAQQLLDQPWASALAAGRGTRTFDRPEQLTAMLEAVTGADRGGS